MKIKISFIMVYLLLFFCGNLFPQFLQITKGEFRINIHLHWFPDNKRLISTITDQEGKIGMGIISAANGERNKIEIGDGFLGDFYTSISPDGRWILFDARKKGTAIQIWKVSAEGGDPEQITQNGGIMPSFSPDGKQFAYVCNNDIYMKDLRTGEERKIIDAGRADFHPYWSPDGKNLVFNPYINDNYEICIVSLSGENLINITNNPAKDLYPCWSPDGSKILFHSDRSGTEDLWIYDIQHKTLEQLTSGRDKDLCPTWSLDGSKIAFSSNRGGKNLEVWVVEIKIHDQTKPSNSKCLGQKPPGIKPEIFAPGLISTKDNIEFAGTFSSDFREFFFTRRENGTFDNRIYHVKFENNKLTKPKLAPFSYDCFEFEPHISPNGHLLYYGTRRPLENSGILAKGTNVWVVKKTSEGWSEPQYPGPPFDEAMFVCVADDETIYNSGLSKSELFNGRYGPWEPIASHLSGPFMHPCIGPDEDYIIFDTDHDLGGKGKSLLISFRNSDGSWGEIISFREIFDFEKFGIPMLTPDYKYLFFSSQGDIYWVDAKVIEELKLRT